MDQDSLLCAKPNAFDTIPLGSYEASCIQKNDEYQTFPSQFLLTTKQIDSIQAGRHEVQSIFKSHLLKVDKPFINRNSAEHKDWICLILLLISILFIWTKVNHSRRIKQIMDGLYAVRYISQQNREKGILSQKGALSLFLVFILSLSMFCFIILEAKIPHSSNALLFSKIALLIIGAYILNLILIKFIGFLLNIKKEINEYITQVFIISEFQGMLFLPITIIIAYAEILKNPLTYILLIILVFMYFFRIFRGVSIISSYSKFSKFYLFLYFCSLEILPMLIIVKILLQFFS